jgi:branched-chain amino acid transport system permease protein
LATVIQIFINSIISGLLLSLVAVGFTFIFRVTKVFHIAHAAIFALSGLFFWYYHLINGPLVFHRATPFVTFYSYFMAVIASLLVAIVYTYVIEKAVYLPLNKTRNNQTISLIASLGIYLVMINIAAILSGNGNKVINHTLVGSFQFVKIIITKIQVLQLLVCILVLLGFQFYLNYTKSSLTLQSVSDNETISKVFGINTEKERIKVFIAGSVLACIAAVLKTMEVGMNPQAGMSITLTAAVVAILVSRLNVFLIIGFAIALTLLQNSLEWFLNAQWKDGITFFILLLVILFRTEGIISYNLRKDRA